MGAAKTGRRGGDGIRLAAGLLACLLVAGCGAGNGSPSPASRASVGTAAPATQASGANGGAPAPPSPVGATTAAPLSWPTYHRDPLRTGVGPADPALDAVRPLWAAPLDGVVYAEPLADGDHLIVATENDTVYALDLATGAIAWRQHLGEPVPRASQPCGNIDPSGMTSTPVIDPTQRVVYAVGRVQPTHHELYALDLATGAVRYHRAVDPPGADPRYLQQRGALALTNGRVYVPFGGNFGDCGPYKGWVVGVPADGQGDLALYGVPTRREGGIWAPPGVVVDGAGNLFVATGNADSTTEFDYANAVIRLSPDLKALDYWAPADWAALSRGDADIGSIAPALLADGQIFQSGKNGMGYLLRADHLGGIGGQVFAAPVCSGAYGGTAYQAPLLYVPCRDSLVALRIGAGSFEVAWRVQHANLNAPIVAYGSVWSIDTSADQLWQIDPSSGARRRQLPLGGPVVAHFPTPTAVGGRLYAPAGRQVLAFGP